MNKIVNADEGYLIQPHHIDVSDHFWDAFGNSETEISARWIVRFLQERGEGWKPFTYAEINGFYERTARYKNFGFNRLTNRESVDVSNAELKSCDWIVLGTDGKYYLTHQFIARCSRPAQPQAVSA